MTNERAYTPSLVLHVLRNPHGWSAEAITAARLQAADEIERLRDALKRVRRVAAEGTTHTGMIAALGILVDRALNPGNGPLPPDYTYHSHEPIPCALAHSADVRQEIKGKGDVPNSQFAGILKAAESGDAVNTIDLINALWWRVGNQRKELGRKNADVERLRNDIQEITCGDVRLVCPNCRPEKGAQGASRDASSSVPVESFPWCTGEPHDCPYVYCHSQLKCAKVPPEKSGEGQ